MDNKKELKDLIIKNDNLTQYFLIVLLKQANKDDKNTFSYDDYIFYKYVLFDKSNKNNINKQGEITRQLKKTYTSLLNNKMIDEIYSEYIKMTYFESKQVLYSLSRLLYLQDKYKNDEIGQTIDTKIKEWIGYIKNNYKKNTKAIEKEQNDLTKTNAILNAIIFCYSIIRLNYINIYFYKKNKHTYTDIWDYREISSKKFINILEKIITEEIEDSKKYYKYCNVINEFINDIESKINSTNFFINKDKDIKSIGKKYGIKDNNYNNKAIPKTTQDAYIEELAKLYNTYLDGEGNAFNIQDNTDVKKWRDKADKFIQHLINYDNEGIALLGLFTMDYTLNHLAYSDYQKEAYKLNLDDEIQTFKAPQDKEIKHDNKLLQATSKQLKAIDNARGGLVTYNETDTQTIKNKLKEKQESLKNTHIKQDKARLKKEIEILKSDLIIAEQNEGKLKSEYKNVCDYLENIYKSMANEPKTSSYYKDLKKAKKKQEQRKKEIERILRFNGWQLDLWGNGSYELVLNKRQKESLKLTIENLSKQIAKYTKEEQDIFDFLISKYLHNTDIKEIKFTLREYEETKKRVRPTNYLMGDIQAIRLLFREVWTYYTTNDKSYTFNEEHLFTRLNIKGELESNLNNLNNANLDTEISLEPTETLQNLLQDHDNYLYISTSLEIMQLNNDNEYLAKRLLKYLNYLARVNKKSVLNISLDTIIEELQHYGLKHFNMLDRHKTYKTEIVDVIDKTLSILEGDNHLNKRFIEVLDRQPFINYDNEYRGKSQETSINEWGKHKIKIKVFDLDDTKLLETKKKQSKKKQRATKK